MQYHGHIGALHNVYANTLGVPMNNLAQPHNQIAVLTDNTIPIVTPLLDKHIACLHLILLASPHHQKALKHLRHFFEGSALDISVIDIDDNLTDMSIILAPFKDAAVAINITEGDKGICSHLLLWANQHSKTCFWLNTQTDTIHFLFPQNVQPQTLADKLKIPTFLALKGMSISSMQSHLPGPKVLRALAIHWAKNAAPRKKAFKSLNRLALSANIKTLISNRYSCPSDKAKPLLRELARENLITVLRDGRIKFSSVEVKHFCSGIWLEYACFEILRSLRSHRTDIQDIAMNVLVERDGSGKLLRNEFDVMALINNRLFIVECKTGTMPTDTQQLILYRLDAFSDLLGTSCHGFLVSLWDLNESVLGRAAEIGMHFLHANDVMTLGHEIANIADGEERN